jgi:hypothetical protein
LHSVGGFCQKQAFVVADLNDRVWSASAGHSWDEPVIQVCSAERWLSSDPVVREPTSHRTTDAGSDCYHHPE